jgi:hypothetical protein
LLMRSLFSRKSGIARKKGGQRRGDGLFVIEFLNT